MVIKVVTYLCSFEKTKINCAKDKDKLKAERSWTLFYFLKSCQDTNRGWGSTLAPQHHLKSVCFCVCVGVCVSAYDLYPASQDWQQSVCITFTVTVTSLTPVFILASRSQTWTDSDTVTAAYADSQTQKLLHIRAHSLLHIFLFPAWRLGDNLKRWDHGRSALRCNWVPCHPANSCQHWSHGILI